MIKFLATLGLCLFVASASGQTIKFYNDASIPQKVVPSGGDVASIQQTGPNAYRWILLSDLREYFAGEAGGVVQVTIVNTNYTTNAFITQLTVISNAFFNSTQFVNVNVTTNLFVTQTNVNNVQYVTNIQVVNNSITTNLSVVNQFNGKQNFTTNIFFLTTRAEDVAWAGATNTADFSLGSLQRYTTFTPFSVTNVIGSTNGYGNPLLLCVTNASGSNVWFYPPSGWKMGTNDTTNVTSGGIFEAWFLEATGRKTIATKLFP